ncbi:MAG: alpha/beta fold hydrolase [Woeseiaceae bacterium]
MNSIRKVYGQSSLGQIHARVIEAEGEEQHPPLLCLHPAPSSGLYFQTAMPLLNSGRRVVAPDYPGYGGSDALSEPPAIDDYARAMHEFLEDFGVAGSVDILGFHTGCLVGTEMVLQNSEAVRRLVLCDIPFFSAEARKALYAKMAVPMPISPELESIQAAWTFNVEGRIEDVPLPRTIELLAEHLRSVERDHFGFAAAFTYSTEEKLGNISVDTTVLATQSALHGATLAAAEIIPDATLIDVTEVTTAVFESGAEAISRRISATLE